MISTLRRWYEKYFTDPQAVLLAVLLVVGFSVVLYLGKILAPVLAALVLAYLLEGLVRSLRRVGVPRIVAVWIVFLLFVTLLVVLAFGVLPIMSRQLSQLFRLLPEWVARGQQLLMLLPERYPEFISASQVKDLMTGMRNLVTQFGENALSWSLASIQGIVTVIVYMILVPLLVFFFLKDKQPLIGWVVGFLPKERRVPRAVWTEMDAQIGNYMRGKFWEIVIVGGVTFAVFSFMGLEFAPLLGLAVGLSVIVPYVGAAVVTLPVALIGYFQWGWSSDFAYVMAAYAVIQALDGNVLVPLLFSEAVNLHPVAIIVAVLFFGGIWGFWGIFFAIPLATLVRALIYIWPRTPQPGEGQGEQAAAA